MNNGSELPDRQAYCQTAVWLKCFTGCDHSVGTFEFSLYLSKMLNKDHLIIWFSKAVKLLFLLFLNCFKW